MDFNDDYRKQLEEIMRSEGMDDDELIKKAIDAQQEIMANADRMLAEMAGVSDISEIMNMPQKDQKRIFRDVNKQLSEMMGVDTIDLSESDDLLMEREEHRKILDGVDVPEALLKELENHYRNAIYIEPTEAEVYPGCSKIGGYPHVPADFQWVRNNDGNALTFLMQINCEEIHPFDKDNIFPEKGMLYFFYDFENEPWDSEENGYSVSFYDGDISELVPCKFPDGAGENYFRYAEENCVIDEQFVKFFAAPNLPEYDDNEEAADKYSYEEYEAARYKLLGYDPDDYSEDYFKLGGYSNSIQCGLSEEFDGSYVQLCQLSTFEGEHSGFMFGDGGSLYFYIKKEDLINRRFDRAEITLQCY